MSIKVSVNSTGYFELDIDTGGAPKGKFLITAGGIEKAVEIVSAEDMPVSTPTPSLSPPASPTPSPQKTTKPFPIPGVGFEVIECIAIATLIIVNKGGCNMLTTNLSLRKKALPKKHKGGVI
jgi:hypothetical protein